MKTWITWKDEKVDDINMTAGKKPDEKKEWKEVPNNWKGSHGDKKEWFDSNMIRIPDTLLIKQGKRINNTGRRWYKKDDPSETTLVHSIDEPISDEWTDETPLEDEHYQMFDEKKNKWVVDEKRKDEVKKERELLEKKSELNTLKEQADLADVRSVRSLKAKIAGTATKDDLAKLNELDNFIENKRAEIRKLEEELSA